MGQRTAFSLREPFWTLADRTVALRAKSGREASDQETVRVILLRIDTMALLQPTITLPDIATIVPVAAVSAALATLNCATASAVRCNGPVENSYGSIIQRL